MKSIVPFALMTLALNSESGCLLFKEPFPESGTGSSQGGTGSSQGGTAGQGGGGGCGAHWTGVNCLSCPDGFDTANCDSCVAGWGGENCNVATTTIESTPDATVSLSEAAPAMALDSDGLASIVYVKNSGNSGNSVVRYARCTNRTCSTFSAPVDLPPTAAVTRYPDIIFSQNLPLVTFAWDISDSLLPRLMVSRCKTMDCKDVTFPEPSLVSGLSWIGATHLAIGTDGLPLVAFAYYDAKFLGVLHCDTADCSSATSRFIERIERSCVASSMTIGTDGNPVFSAIVNGTGSNDFWLEIVHCGDPKCAMTTTSAIAQVGGSWAHDTFTSIAAGADGNPLVAYYTEKEVFLAHCHDQQCSSASSSSLGKTELNLGLAGFQHAVKLLVDAHGLPWVVYMSNTTQITILRCLDATCTNVKSYSVDTVRELGAGLDAVLGKDGLPLLSYSVRDTSASAGELRVVSFRSTFFN